MIHPCEQYVGLVQGDALGVTVVSMQRDDNVSSQRAAGQVSHLGLQCTLPTMLPQKHSASGLGLIPHQQQQLFHHSTSQLGPRLGATKACRLLEATYLIRMMPWAMWTIGASRSAC